MSKEKELSISEQLHTLLYKELGNNWRQDIKLSVRVDNLYWFVHLIEAGIEAKRKEFKEDKTSGAGETMSLASWCIDLEQLFNQIKAAVVHLKKGKK